MIKYDLKKLKKSLDILWSQLIKIRDKRCIRCGRIDRLNSAHIFSRSQMSVRWDLDNGICLCGGCHLFWWHKNPIEAAEFIKEFLGVEKYEKLRVKARTLAKVDIDFLEKNMSDLHGFEEEYSCVNHKNSVST
jgi:hypothetical protein